LYGGMLRSVGILRPCWCVFLEQGHQCRDYVLKFSIGHVTWRPLRGRLSRAAEMDDMCNRVNRERATFSPLVPVDGGTSVAHSNGVYLSGFREAPARRDPCDPPQIARDMQIEGDNHLTRCRHEADTRRQVGDRADKCQSCDTWQHPRLPRRHMWQPWLTPFSHSYLSTRKAARKHTVNIRLYALQLYIWGIFLARGRTRTQYSTVCRRPSRPRASQSKPCNVDPIFQLGNLEAQRVAC